MGTPIDSFIPTDKIPKTPIVLSMTTLGGVIGGLYAYNKKVDFGQGLLLLGGGIALGMSIGYVIHSFFETMKQSKQNNPNTNTNTDIKKTTLNKNIKTQQETIKR